MILFKKQKNPSDCKQIFVSSVIKAKSIWLKRTVKVHRRQWGFCLFFSKLHVILFGAPSPSHTHPTQVQRWGWLTGFWLKPASLHFPCHLTSCGSLSQTQKPLSTPTGVFGFDFICFSFWSLWRGTAIQCQSHPESVCTKSSSAQRPCRRAKAVPRSCALSKRHSKVTARLSLPLDLTLFR